MTEEQKLNKVNIGKEIIEWIIYFIAVLVASFAAKPAICINQVHQSSMQNTLLEGHTLIIDKINYQFSKPKRGDIVVFLRGEDTKGLLTDIRF